MSTCCHVQIPLCQPELAGILRQGLANKKWGNQIACILDAITCGGALQLEQTVTVAAQVAAGVTKVFFDTSGGSTTAFLPAIKETMYPVIVHHDEGFLTAEVKPEFGGLDMIDGGTVLTLPGETYLFWSDYVTKTWHAKLLA